MGFQELRVLNEDRVQPGKGFGTHPHRDMEILSLVISGTLRHRDSMGNGSVIRPGDVQRMSAGTGVTHSESNDSESEPVHFFQIWILPDRTGLTPGYEQRTFAAESRRDKALLVASQNGRDGSVTLHADASVYASILETGRSLEVALARDRHAWVQVIRGRLSLLASPLESGDGASVSGESLLRFEAAEESEFLLFDLV
jgi:redox-sensitive bicupin YhaK (pirin superfamily)